MRQVRRFWFLAVGFCTAIVAYLLTPGQWLNRLLAVALCTVLTTDQVCLPHGMTGRAVAAMPQGAQAESGLVAQFEAEAGLVADRSSEFDDVPMTPVPSNTVTPPPYPVNPGPNFPVRRPDFSDGIDNAAENAANDVCRQDRKRQRCDFSTVPEVQKCFGGTGSQCEQHPMLGQFNPKYNFETCEVETYVTPGSQAHDQCCIQNPTGYACSGWSMSHYQDSLNKVIPCEREWQQARDNLLHDLNPLNQSNPVGRWRKMPVSYIALEQPAPCPESRNNDVASATNNDSEEYFDVKLSKSEIPYRDSAILTIQYVNPDGNSDRIVITGSGFRGLGQFTFDIPAVQNTRGELNFNLINQGYAIGDGECTNNRDNFINVAISSSAGTQLFYKQIKPVSYLGSRDGVTFPCSAIITSQ